MNKVELRQDFHQRRSDPETTDELKPLPENDVCEEYSTSSLRRNSFLKAQSKSISFDEEPSEPAKQSKGKKPGKKKSSSKTNLSLKDEPSSSSTSRNVYQDGHDNPLLQESIKVTII